VIIYPNLRANITGSLSCPSNDARVNH